MPFYTRTPKDWFEDYGKGHPYLWAEALKLLESQEGLWDWQRQLLMDYMQNSIYGLQWNPKRGAVLGEEQPDIGNMLGNLGKILSAPSREQRLGESREQLSPEEAKYAKMPTDVSALYPLIRGYKGRYAAEALPPKALTSLLLEPEKTAPTIWSGFGKHLMGHYGLGAEKELPLDWGKISEAGKKLIPGIYDWYVRGEQKARQLTHRFPAPQGGGGLLKQLFSGGGPIGQMAGMAVKGAVGAGLGALTGGVGGVAGAGLAGLGGGGLTGSILGSLTGPGGFGQPFDWEEWLRQYGSGMGYYPGFLGGGY